MKTLSILLACAALSPMLHAEPPTPLNPLPSGALLSRAPEASAWTITSTPMEASPPSLVPTPTPGEKKGRKKDQPSDQPAGTRPSGVPPVEPSARVVFTKSGGILHLQIAEKQAGASEKWCKGEIEVTTRADWAAPVVSAPGDRYDVAYTDFSKSDFPALTWINRKNYTGMEKRQAHVCMVFKDRISVNTEDRAASPGTSAQTIDVSAYVDYYSRLPVEATRDGVCSAYEFEVPPPVAQVLPPEIAKVIEERQNRLRELSRASGQPCSMSVFDARFGARG